MGYRWVVAFSVACGLLAIASGFFGLLFILRRGFTGPEVSHIVLLGLIFAFTGVSGNFVGLALRLYDDRLKRLEEKIAQLK